MRPRAPDSYQQIGREALLCSLGTPWGPQAESLCSQANGVSFSPLLPPPASPLLPSLSWEKAPYILTLQSLGSLLPLSTRDGPGKLGSTRVESCKSLGLENSDLSKVQHRARGSGSRSPASEWTLLLHSHRLSTWVWLLVHLGGNNCGTNSQETGISSPLQPSLVILDLQRLLRGPRLSPM